MIFCYMVFNVFITVFISYLTYSDYIFHGAALVALPCSCDEPHYFIVLLRYILLICYLTCCACSCTVNNNNKLVWLIARTICGPQM